jgi:hypothetical protein
VLYCGLTEVPPANSSYAVPKLCNLEPVDVVSNPSDVSATLDKKSFDLPASTANETMPRDTANLTVSSLQDAKTGVYRIAVGLTTDGIGIHSSMVYVDVQ